MKKNERGRRIGLARALSKLGYCSRARASELIRAGRVRLNGKVLRDPEAPVSESDDGIAVDDDRIKPPEKLYLMINKPRGVITTASDEKGRETVYALLPEPLPWVGPVGRLDKASEGLLLLTNDTEWAARISDPDSHLEKTYHVQVRATGNELPIESLLKGVLLRGELLRAKAARVLREGDKNSWIEIVLDEGKNRQIRRMFEHFGIQVARLIRIGIGPLRLGRLAKGESRSLTGDEKLAMDHAMMDFHKR